MIVKALLAAGAATVGFLGWKKYKKPTADDFQSVNVIGAGGVPIKVTTPVSTTVTQAQATGVPTSPPVRHSPVPTTVPGKGVVYAPPGTIHVTAQGDVLQPPPIIVSPAGSSSLGIGSVKDVQHALNTLGYCKPPLSEDGKLGPMTIACIRAFQSKNHLAADGNAGPATRAALSTALTVMAGGNSPVGATVQAGNPASGQVTSPTGQVIDTKAALAMTNAQVQHSLNLTGASPKLGEDGKFGPKTIAALKSFQAAHGLIPDGVAGAKTKTALYLAQAQATH